MPVVRLVVTNQIVAHEKAHEDKRPGVSPRTAFLVVVAVLLLPFGLLLLAVIVASSRTHCGFRGKCLADLVELRNGVLQHVEEHGTLPRDLAEVVPLLHYRAIPRDPWKMEYHYRIDAPGLASLYSWGADNRPDRRMWPPDYHITVDIR